LLGSKSCRLGKEKFVMGRPKLELRSFQLLLLLLTLLVTSTSSFQSSYFSIPRHGSTFLQAEQETTTTTAATTTSSSRTWKQRPSPREKIPSIASNSAVSTHPPPISSTRDESSLTRIKQEQDTERQRRQRYESSINNNSWNKNSSRSTWSDVNGTGQRRRDALNNNDSVIKTTSSISSTSSSSFSRRQKTKPMPITGYDAQAIEAFYDRRPLQVGWRLNSLGFPLLGWYMRLLYDKAIGTFDNPLVQRKRGQELRNLLIQSKSVALIKSGQALSLRPDLIRNEIWAQELSKLVDAVGSFSDIEAMHIIKNELVDLYPRLAVTRSSWEKLAKQRLQNLKQQATTNGRRRLSRLEKMVAKDDVLSLFEFYNDNKAVASASIGQVYKARLRRGAQLEAAIGAKQAAIWGDKIVAIKVQRPDVEASASLDMYLLRRSAMWASRVRGGDLPQVADAFGMQLFGELDYVREANNCDRFRELYGNWDDVLVPAACSALTRRRVLVMEWVDGYVYCHSCCSWMCAEGHRIIIDIHLTHFTHVLFFT
jgi:ABC1 atypical kinase-like domain